ncbi:hypothetical protein AX17_002029 [Amanita inopinata Kibby_2008]|nr:hypothetical protein AX17_002029 [Amanita inopinata Kibby_2008]
MSIDLNLDRLQQLVQHLPPYTCPSIHIAGTNGKGSVSAYLSHILAASHPPFKVGRFNSPHLLVPRDSITINNEPVSLELYTSARSIIENADAEHGTQLSSFELLTLTAFRVFEDEKVDVAVVEVGMGGRLDATNILPTSVILASALTSVDLDHQAFLGPTVAHIAKEKASVARQGRPFILGKQKHKEVDEMVQTVVSEFGATLLPAIRVTKREWHLVHDGKQPEFSLDANDFREPPPQPVTYQLPCLHNKTFHAQLHLFGDHQLENLGVALGVISSLFTHAPADMVSKLDLQTRVTPQSIADGIRMTRWPGRLSFHTISLSPKPHSRRDKAVILVDGAHNASSAQTLGEYVTHLLTLLPSHIKRLRLSYVLALSHSPPKTPLQTLSPLLPLRLPSARKHHLHVQTRIALVEFTPPEGMSWVKSVSPLELQEVVKSLVGEADIWVARDAENEGESPDEMENSDLEEALRWAIDGDHAGIDGQFVILAGSLYLVADFYRLVESAA